MQVNGAKNTNPMLPFAQAYTLLFWRFQPFEIRIDGPSNFVCIAIGERARACAYACVCVCIYGNGVSVSTEMILLGAKYEPPGRGGRPDDECVCVGVCHAMLCRLSSLLSHKGSSLFLDASLGPFVRQ